MISIEVNNPTHDINLEFEKKFSTKKLFKNLKLKKMNLFKNVIMNLAKQAPISGRVINPFTTIGF